MTIKIGCRFRPQYIINNQSNDAIIVIEPKMHNRTSTSKEGGREGERERDVERERERRGSKGWDVMRR